MYRRNDRVDGSIPGDPTPPADHTAFGDAGWDTDRFGQSYWRDHLDAGWRPGPSSADGYSGPATADDYPTAGRFPGDGGYGGGGHPAYGADRHGHSAYDGVDHGDYPADPTGQLPIGDGYHPQPYGRPADEGYDTHLIARPDGPGYAEGPGYADAPHGYDRTGSDAWHAETGTHRYSVLRDLADGPGDANGWPGGDDGWAGGDDRWADDDRGPGPGEDPTDAGPLARAARRRRSDARGGSDPEVADGRRRRLAVGPVTLATLVVVLLVAIGGGGAMLRAGFGDDSTEGTDDTVVTTDVDPVPDPLTEQSAGTEDPQIGEPEVLDAELGAAPTPAASPAPPPPTSAAPSPRRSTAAPESSRPQRTTAAPAKTSAAPQQTATGDTSRQQQVLALVNAARDDNGCGAVTINDQLAEAARLHSEDQATNNDMSHEGSDGSDPWERARRAGYEQAIGENVAAGYPTAEAVMEGWMNSPGHRANILNCDAVAMGVGTATSSNGTLYWTQMFGSER
ncbi:CAP domain-containing protein [Micromonospora sp. LOL_021]|uniref:CAP domain-containing protein n=1 Tax=Micromonospora sp. LOL_021 TaxID=3345417 RepID=UPI003A86CBC7